MDAAVSKLRIAFLARSFSPQTRSQIPLVMQVLTEVGAVVDLIHPLAGVTDLSNVRVDHDLYVLHQIDGFALSLAGALHAQGAAIVNPYPATLALRDKIVTFRILQTAGVHTPATYVTSHPDKLAPLLEAGPLIVKPYKGTGGHGVRVIRSAAELADVPHGKEGKARHGKEPVFAQRYHPPQGSDSKMYVIGGRIFGVKKIFPRRTEAEKHGEPFKPTPELCEIVVRCGEAFGIDLYGVDIIESDGTAYVVDMGSIPGFKGVPDAPQHLARYFYAAAERAARGQPPFEPAAPTEAVSAEGAR
jgi:ribosomal protein S6--L-glutamate ligase